MNCYIATEGGGMNVENATFLGGDLILYWSKNEKYTTFKYFNILNFVYIFNL